uniref:SWIRM domain-containing protein n=1 Tax=Rhabditophanes sp. KR3021 TaxID=114890 RepID=A0AC35UB40_9BILA
MAELILTALCSEQLKYALSTEDELRAQLAEQTDKEEWLGRLSGSDAATDTYSKLLEDEVFLLKIGNTAGLPLNFLCPSEKSLFPEVGDKWSSEEFVKIRNKLLGTWYKTNSAFLSLGDAIKLFKTSPESTNTNNKEELIKDIYNYLNRKQLINYGVLHLVDHEPIYDVSGPKAVVIGAGIAGLACAKQLTRMGIQVLVLEANSLTGGRIQTIESPDGLKIDIGASMINAEWKNEMTILIDQCKIGVDIVPEKVILMDHKKDLFNENVLTLTPKIFMEDMDLLLFGDDEFANLPGMTVKKALDVAYERKDVLAEYLRNKLFKEFEDAFALEQSEFMKAYVMLTNVLKEWNGRKHSFNEYCKAEAKKLKSECLIKQKESAARNSLISNLITHVSLKKFEISLDNIQSLDEMHYYMEELVESINFYQNTTSDLSYCQVKDILVGCIEGMFGESVETLPLSALKTMPWTGRRSKFITCQNGMQDLVECLKDGYQIETNRVVKKVSYSKSEDKYIISGDNFTEEANIVVCTLPIGVLKANDVVFEPPLPESKLEALNKSKIALKKEVIFEFENMFWDKHKAGAFCNLPNPFNSTDVDSFGTIFAVPGKPVLVVSYIGAKLSTIVNWSEEKVVSRAFQVIKNFFEKQTLRYKSVFVKDWENEPFIKGYHIVPTEDESLIESLAKSVSVDSKRCKLYFGGEHTNRDCQGTVNAAFCSGLRVAGEIASDFNDVLNY